MWLLVARREVHAQARIRPFAIAAKSADPRWCARRKREAKAEAWRAQMDEWRERLEGQLAGLRGDVKAGERRSEALQEALTQRPTSMDLKQAVEGVSLACGRREWPGVGPRRREELRRGACRLAPQLTRLVCACVRLCVHGRSRLASQLPWTLRCRRSRHRCGPLSPCSPFMPCPPPTPVPLPRLRSCHTLSRP
jgi:hypothetical protein